MDIHKKIKQKVKHLEALTPLLDLENKGHMLYWKGLTDDLERLYKERLDLTKQTNKR